MNFYVIIAGSRQYNDYNEFCHVLDFLLKNQKRNKIIIVSGGCIGTDSLAAVYADTKGYEKHIIKAEWKKYGKSAGYIRNKAMHDFIIKNTHSRKERGCVCFWNEVSKGTQHNFKLCYDFDTPLRVYS